MPTLYTIGHSTRSEEDFISLLQENNIEILVDVRSLPGSTRYPQFNQEQLEISLPLEHIEYRYFKDLGGLRPKQAHSHNTVWSNASFRNYADYMETEQRQEAAQYLAGLASQYRCAIMCSEAVRRRCHRSMIADYFKSIGREVLHIMGKDKLTEHPYTAPAKIVNGTLYYGAKEQ